MTISVASAEMLTVFTASPISRGEKPAKSSRIQAWLTRWSAGKAKPIRTGTRPAASAAVPARPWSGRRAGGAVRCAVVPKRWPRRAARSTTTSTTTTASMTSASCAAPARFDWLIQVE